MSSSHGNAHSDTAKMEQIIKEFFAKSLHIILESRTLYVSSHNSSSSSSPSTARPRDKWFNLALKECPAALGNINLSRRNNLESIIIDVILVHRPRSSSLKKRYPLCCNIDEEQLGVEEKSEKIVERWVVQYEKRKIKDSNSGNRRSSNISLHKLYKKLTLLLRSLYATVRLLPAYTIFRDLNSSSQIRPFTLAHQVSSFVEPFTRKEELKMMKFGFTPVDTSSDPLKRFSSLPLAGLPCRDSPPSRRHSWNFDPYRASSASIAHPSYPPLRGLRCTSKIDRSAYAIQTGATADRLSSLVGKDEPQKYSGIRISANRFPQISVSRSSSRSYHDDFDDTDFSCPFDIGDDDMKDPGSSYLAESLDHGHMGLEAGGFFPIRKSQNAAVGALVHMLKKAPPLHQNLHTSKHPSLTDSLTTLPTEISNQKPEEESVYYSAHSEIWNNKRNQILEASKPGSIMSSGIITTRKTTRDALEEFHGYREMKKLLLMADSNKHQI